MMWMGDWDGFLYPFHIIEVLEGGAKVEDRRDQGPSLRRDLLDRFGSQKD